MKKAISLILLLTGISLELFLGFHKGDPLLILSLRTSVIVQQILIGIILAGGGLILQTLIHNPLAEPYTLGVTSGASAGAVIAVFLNLSPLFFFRTSFALIGSFVVSGLVYLLSQSQNRFSMNVAILAGVGFNALFSSLIMLLQALLLPNNLSASIHWLMGQIDFNGPVEIGVLALSALISIVFLVRNNKTLAILLTGEEMASATGVDVSKLQKAGFLTVSLTSAIAVSLSGMIGFVGLVIPHIARLLSPKKALPDPFSLILLSSNLMVYAGLLSKYLIAGTTLSIGVITSLIGAPFFIFLLVQQNKG